MMTAYRRELSSLLLFTTFFFSLGSTPLPEAKRIVPHAIQNPILFVTQVPVPADFTTIGSVFGNHLPDIDSAPRGGDLMIRYADGSVKNLTRTAGFGVEGLQGATSIAVREPSVHWSGTKALFSMVIGAPTQQYVRVETWWQIYEITGLGPNDTPVITRIARQPERFNNVSPIYGTDDRIIFTSDRPHNGARHLHPQLDEYEEAPTVSGLWRLDPLDGQLELLDHSPSGDFTPTLDSFGRVLFTRWDHLQRDQQADADTTAGGSYGTFNFSDESENATRSNSREEVFPEPRGERPDLLAGTDLIGHSFNHFFPWQINEDGSEAETLNHIGRHELHAYFDRSQRGDPNIAEFVAAPQARFNDKPIFNFLQVRESATSPGTYIGVDAPEFRTHAAGQIVSFDAPPHLPADQIRVNWLTPESTSDPIDDGSAAPADHSGLYRNPIMMSDGTLVAIHTGERREDRNEGTRANPRSRYDFRLKALRKDGSHYIPDTVLTAGVTKTVSYWDPDMLITYSGALWELDPTEVRARPRPAPRRPVLERPEADVFAEEGVGVEELRTYLKKNGLALIVSRDVTSRDVADKQQPYNLKVSGSAKQTTGAAGAVYEVKHLELFQGDQIRGTGGVESPNNGRRVLAQRMHAPAARNPGASSNPAASVRVAADGSVAALVPARRAMTWQLTDPAGKGVVRERYWVTFQPGEMRVCASCHGLNSRDQAGAAVPQNKPEALREMLRFYKSTLKAPPGRKRPVRR